MAHFNHPVAVLNSSIVTADGLYDLETVSLEEARQMVKGKITSFVGHQPTNDVLTRLLGVEIPYNRGLFTHQVGQVALVCRLEGGRIPNGVQLSESELAKLGFSFKRLIRLD